MRMSQNDEFDILIGKIRRAKRLLIKYDFLTTQNDIDPFLNLVASVSGNIIDIRHIDKANVDTYIKLYCYMNSVTNNGNFLCIDLNMGTNSTINKIISLEKVSAFLFNTQLADVVFSISGQKVSLRKDRYGSNLLDKSFSIFELKNYAEQESKI